MAKHVLSCTEHFLQISLTLIHLHQFQTATAGGPENSPCWLKQLDAVLSSADVVFFLFLDMADVYQFWMECLNQR